MKDRQQLYMLQLQLIQSQVETIGKDSFLVYDVIHPLFTKILSQTMNIKSVLLYLQIVDIEIFPTFVDKIKALVSDLGEAVHQKVVYTMNTTPCYMQFVIAYKQYCFHFKIIILPLSKETTAFYNVR